MFSDYTGKVLHEAKYRGFIDEAKGGWLLKQARADEPRRLNLKRVLALSGAALIVLLIAATILQNTSFI